MVVFVSDKEKLFHQLSRQFNLLDYFQGGTSLCVFRRDMTVYIRATTDKDRAHRVASETSSSWESVPSPEGITLLRCLPKEGVSVRDVYDRLVGS